MELQHISYSAMYYELQLTKPHGGLEHYIVQAVIRNAKWYHKPLLIYTHESTPVGLIIGEYHPNVPHNCPFCKGPADPSRPIYEAMYVQYINYDNESDCAEITSKYPLGLYANTDDAMKALADHYKLKHPRRNVKIAQGIHKLMRQVKE